METESLNKTLSELEINLRSLESARQQVEIVAGASNQLTESIADLLKEISTFKNDIEQKNSDSFVKFSNSLLGCETKLKNLMKKGDNAISEYIDSLQSQIFKTSQNIDDTNERIISLNSEISKSIELHTKQFSSNTLGLINKTENKIEELKISSSGVILKQADQVSWVIKHIEETNKKAQQLIDIVSNYNIPNSLEEIHQNIEELHEQNVKIKTLLIILLSVACLSFIGLLLWLLI